MKKVFSIFLAMLGIAAIAETKVLCTTQPMMILAKASLHRIPGIKLEQMISSSLGCPHDYVLTPEDMRKLSTADVIIMNGLGMEDFLEKALPKLKKGVVLLDTSKDVKGLLDSADSCTNNAQHDHAKCNHAKNEHLFAGPETAAQAALNISKYFMDKDPKNSPKILAKAEVFASGLNKIAREYEKFGSRIPADKRNIAVQHGIFDYLAKAAGLNVKAYLQKHTGAEPSAAEIKELIEKLKKENVVLILAEKGYPDRVTKLISNETKIPVVTLEAYPPNGVTDPAIYLNMFGVNLAKLKAFYSK